ncbi:RodZ domain-containing protein [Acidovorax sp.]|uniref:helix-turn-helix domain-containing protein n=1 Tax=Acidovorax sp. TaxID=1872122 RepID=UPI00391F2177
MSDAAEQGNVTAGSVLREARQASGLHIAALAVALKVPVSKLEALEADDYASLPDTVFVRALASSVCRTLKIEPSSVLALLPQSKSPRLEPYSAGLSALVKDSGVRNGVAGSSASSAPRSVIWVVAFLLIGALAVRYLPRDSLPEALSPPPTPSSSPLGSGPDSVSLPAAMTASETTERSDVPPGALPMPVPAPALTTTAPGGTAPAVARAAEPVASAPESSVGLPGVGSGVPLVLRASAESWVQVRDSSGVSVLQRKLSAGETVSVGGSMPLAVVVGRADVIEVFVRGKPFDVLAVSRENVARFEVK